MTELPPGRPCGLEIDGVDCPRPADLIATVRCEHCGTQWDYTCCIECAHELRSSLGTHLPCGTSLTLLRCRALSSPPLGSVAHKAPHPSVAGRTPPP